MSFSKLNCRREDIPGYVKLIRLGSPCFIELKAFSFVGGTRHRHGFFLSSLLPTFPGQTSVLSMQVFEKSANSCLQIQRSELEAFDLGRRKFDKFSVIPNVQVINHSISIIRDSREHTRKMKREEEKREEEDILFSQDIRRIRGVIYVTIGNLSSLCDHMCALLNFSTSCSYPDHPLLGVIRIGLNSSDRPIKSCSCPTIREVANILGDGILFSFSAIYRSLSGHFAISQDLSYSEIKVNHIERIDMYKATGCWLCASKLSDSDTSSKGRLFNVFAYKKTSTNSDVFKIIKLDGAKLLKKVLKVTKSMSEALEDHEYYSLILYCTIKLNKRHPNPSTVSTVVEDVNEEEGVVSVSDRSVEDEESDYSDGSPHSTSSLTKETSEGTDRTEESEGKGIGIGIESRPTSAPVASVEPTSIQGSFMEIKEKGEEDNRKWLEALDTLEGRGRLYVHIPL
ncbi:hypothetical protein ADUPG1_009641 [Aduncisulcus paluster]|uniref:Uncharacterized protein n=1 Tax=Aduncisulcus paluster TaxID=2918883 RepID=A0ABQ5KZ37_9EUKA|nr:hypothetical protein ADUPG1_009641 [Aduncisulcus paluster]